MAARIVVSVDPASLARPDRQPDLTWPPDHRRRRWRSRRRHRHRQVPRHLPRARRRGRGPAGAVAVRPRRQSLVLPRHGVTRGLRTAAPIPSDRSVVVGGVASFAVQPARRPYPSLTEAPRNAVTRGVQVTVVIETPRAPAAPVRHRACHAFTGIQGVALYHWPPARRQIPDPTIHNRSVIQ
jgi:hypothetical protein